MKINFKLVYFLGINFLCLACTYNEADIKPIETFFPKIKLGTYWEYETKKIVLSTTQKTETKNYEKDLVTSIVNYNGIEYFVISTFSKSNLNDSYTQTSTKLWQLTNKILIENSGKDSFQKISLPIEKNTSWKQSLYLNSDLQNHSKVSEVNKPYYFNNSEYFDGFNVILKNDSSAVLLNQQNEVYSPKFGLLESKVKEFQYCQSSKECLGKGIIENGIEYHKKLLKFNL